MYPGNTVGVPFVIKNGYGQLKDADITPLVTVQRNGIDTTVTPTVTKMSTGFYRITIQLPNTWLDGDLVSAKVDATVDGFLDTLLLKVGCVSTTVSSRASSTALDTLQLTASAIKIQTDKFVFTSGQVHSVAKVIEDKTGYTLTTQDKAALATAVESALTNETDGNAFLQTLKNALNLSTGGIDQPALVLAIKQELERDNGKLVNIQQLTVINEALKIISLQAGIPHTTDLPA